MAEIEDCDKVICAKKAPVSIEVEAGKTYYWCTCGRSKNQPFCDGSHKGTEFAPMPWTAEEAGTKYFCACKVSGKKPFCDGSHRNLPEDAVGKAFAKDYVPPKPA